MHKRPLRTDKACLNCGHQVEERYCTHCGQENIEHRQSFPQLTAHFAEDLTHYDGKFWSSLKLLFFKPARLTKHYLSGKITSYLPPVRMYIFASFITFLLPHLIPEAPQQNKVILERPRIDTNVIGETMNFAFITDSGLLLESPYKSKYKLDSAYDAQLVSDTPMDRISYLMYKKSVDLQEYTSLEVMAKFEETLGRNFPKTLFLYMPLFALIIRLFHSKRNWIYFDHAVFTLHYFSFMLLAFCLMIILSSLSDWLNVWWWKDDSINEMVFACLFSGIALWFTLYFFRAHRVMYGESWAISTLKAFGIFTLNLSLFIILFIILVIFSIWMLH